MSKKLPFNQAVAFSIPAVFARVTVFLLLVAFLPEKSFSQGATLVMDVATQGEAWSSEYTHLINGNGTFYFTTYRELWKSDGTVEGTVKVKEFKLLRSVIWADNALYFLADDGINGAELWKSDGTASGTSLIKDIRGGLEGSAPSDLTSVNGTIYFIADDGIHGKELWKSDGTEAGTIIVKDIMSVVGTSNPALLTAVDGTLFFTANDGQHGYEVWKTDGTTTGTVMVKDVRSGASSTPESLTAVNGSLFFVANDGSGKELWKCDGTSSGTFRVKDIFPGSKHSGIENMTAVNNTLFFTASDGVYGHELWKSDGTEEGTVMVKDMTPGGAGSHGENTFAYRMGGFTDIKGVLYYVAYANDIFYMWRSDGTPEGTIPLREAQGPGIRDPFPQFTYMDGSIYYFNNAGPDDYALFRMEVDGSNPQLLETFIFVDYYNPYYPGILAVGNSLYVTGRPANGGEKGFTIIKSDGTREGTAEFFDVDKSTISSNPDKFVTFNGKVYFSTTIEEYPYSDWESSTVWETDGTAEGTREVIPAILYPTITAAQDILYISGESGNNGLWKVDRTGTVTRLSIFGMGTWIAKAVTVGNMLYFCTEGEEIWRSDGTAEGTFPLMTASGINSFTATETGVMFQLGARTRDEELWKSEGTSATTVKIATIRSGGGVPSKYYPTAVMDGILYFVANDGIHGNELWRSDGTASGTYMALDVNGNDKVEADYTGTEYDLRTMTVFKDHLYFGARQIILGDGGTDEWSLRTYSGSGMSHGVVDETDPITSMVADDDKLYFLTEKTAGSDELWVYPQGEPLRMLAAIEGLNSEGLDYEIIDGVMYYSTRDGQDLWRTDGTRCGTLALQTGTVGAYPMEALGRQLIFASTSREYGTEPFSFDVSQDTGNPCQPVGECSASGTITREYWEGVQGSRVSDIPLHAPPTGTQVLTTFEGPSFNGSHYGARISGYVCPPQTGNYHFYISSNDHSELWLSDSEDPANKVRIAYVTGATGIRQWDKYASQRSFAIPLTKAKKYYIEALHKQGVGSDHIAVGWALPDGAHERPIPGHRLSPFEITATTVGSDGNAALSDASYAQISIYPNPAMGGDPSLTVAGYEGIEESVVTEVEIVNIAGEVVFSDRVSCGGGCNAYLMNVNKALVPGIYIVHLKTKGARFSKRLLIK